MNNLSLNMNRLMHALLCSFIVIEGVAFAAEMTEIVLPFNQDKSYQIITDEEDHKITLEIKNAHSSELEPLFLYSGEFLKRVVIQDHTPDGVSAHLYLKNKNLRVSVYSLEQPFRIVVSIFKRGYKPKRDPITRLPILTGDQGNKEKSIAKETAPESFFDRKEPRMKLAKSRGLVHQPQSLFVDQKDPDRVEPSKRKLLQPIPDLGEGPKAWEKKLSTVKPGRGSHWDEFPVYVYPIPLAAYEGREHPEGWKPKSSEPNMTRGQQIARYSLKLFSFGHENRALIGYQQVLHEEPKVFENDPLHLWAFAESHLGQGNLVLADGYYKTLINRFPESSLKSFAQLRRLDIVSIRLKRSNKFSQFSQLTQKSADLNLPDSDEILSQLAIRQAFWQQPDSLKLQQVPPSPSVEIIKTLNDHSGAYESRHTSFLSATLLMKGMLDKDTLWEPSISQFATQFFERYKDRGDDDFYKSLKKQFEDKLSKALITYADEKRYGEGVISFSNLNKNLRSVAYQDLNVAWAIGESYRFLGQETDSIPFYQEILQRGPSNLARLKSAFWVAWLGAKEASRSRAATQKRRFAEQSRKADRILAGVWKEVDQKDKDAFLASYKPHLEAVINSSNRLRTPPVILLSAWDQALSTRMDASTSASQNEIGTSAYSPSANTVFTLKKVADRFNNLGMNNERNRALSLMKKLKPDNFKDDAAAQSTWVNELVRYAEELRKRNSLAKAGEIYTYAARNSGAWNKRAEVLYKGALLLYRAGQREEALQALEEASQDGNNLFYANLAKERLSQLSRQ